MENPMIDVYIPYIFIEWSGIRKNRNNDCPGKQIQNINQDNFNLIFIDISELVSLLLKNGFKAWNRKQLCK